MTPTPTTAQPGRSSGAATARRTVTLTGFQPTGDLHLGNYVGAIRPLADLAADPGRDVSVFVADLHALNGRPDPAALHERFRLLVATLIACGLDRPNVHVYRQSRVPAVAGMVAVLNNVTAKGLLNRAHFYKATVAANIAAGHYPDHGVNMGLYGYPVLMAADADILALKADEVPVGVDQAAPGDRRGPRPAVLAQLPTRRAARAAGAHRRGDRDAPRARRAQDEQVLR